MADVSLAMTQVESWPISEASRTSTMKTTSGYYEDDEPGYISEGELQGQLDRVEKRLRTKEFVERLDHHEEDQKLFLDEFDDYLGLKPPEGIDNVLHLMAGKRPVSTYLIGHMLHNHGERMNDRDSAQRRPLIIAIDFRKESFIETVLANTHDNASLDLILGASSSDDSNGIHKAITKGLSSKIIIGLINRVSDATLRQTDSHGCTPLHLAVEYPRCNQGQLDVVKALLKRGNSALDVRGGRAHLSVYQYHFSTRIEQDTAGVQEEDLDDLINSQNDEKYKLVPWGLNAAPDLRSGTSIRRGSVEAPSQSVMHPTINSMAGHSRAEHLPSAQARPKHWPRTIQTQSGMQTTHEEAETLTSPAGYQANSSRRTTTTHPQVPGVSDQSPGTISPDTAAKFAPVRRPRRKLLRSTQPNVRESASKEHADKIAEALKLHYLRTTFTDSRRNHDTAIDFLYGNKEAKHIFFNLHNNYKPMSERDLERGSYSRFEFESVLRLVAVGPVAMQQHKKAPVSDIGRRDLVEVFRWLSKKGVKNIVRVIVNDSTDPCHADETIIEALREFSIDELDWSKPNLCPEAILKACHGIRRLDLSWSGLNGMLLAWGGLEGLARLPKLTEVYLYQTKVSEPMQWTATKLDEFEARLRHSRNVIRAERTAQDDLFPDIIVHRPSDRSRDDSTIEMASANHERQSEPRIRDHKWLGCIDRFASGIFTLKPDVYIKSVSTLPDELKKNVRVCLIDDGVDIRHRSLQDRIDITGRTFGVNAIENYHRISPLPYYDSMTNHGTLMASMIARVCPFATITSYRMDMWMGDDNKFHPAPESAADALEFALKHDFDIISMSWSIKEGKNDKNVDTRRIRNMLNQSEAAKKIIFCSAPDAGNLSPDDVATYVPVGTSANHLFRIGAATADNMVWQRVGGHCDYLFPGYNVREKEGDEVIQYDNSPKSGSSIATALAAGFAALLIHVVRMAVIRTYQQNREDKNDTSIIDLASLAAIKLPETMRKTFDSMAKDQKYVHVSSNFEYKANQLASAEDADEPEMQKWRVIGDLARDIVLSEMRKVKELPN
ncbi:hypothetical protein F5Y18DRAFT_315386 [Xylariaceae sp. FL1019]|nr:hypothetical protein F5Y18DRAFT_315386 [Xylariaceae sp. FL1019]